MTKKEMSQKLVQASLLLGAGLTLTACEVRRDGDSPTEPDTSQTEAVAEPTPNASTSAASIIREDIAPVEPEVIPTEPVELVLPFPDGADVTPQVERMLTGVLESNAIQEGWPVILGGHTDSTGNDLANLRASRSRAEAVAAWLVERGVADERITVVAFGEQNPLAPNAKPDGTPDEAARRQNRRVELRIAPRTPPRSTASAPPTGSSATPASRAPTPRATAN